MGDTSDGEMTQDFCRRVVPPNKRKMEAELDPISREITEKDNKVRSLQVKLDNLGVSAELQKIRTAKEEKIDNRKVINQQLSVLSGEIGKKKDALAKLKLNLPYLKEEKIDEAIRRLRRELQTRNFRLNEERKIVNEIDSLNRSKRGLREYQSQNEGLNKMREKQKKMRDELNVCYKAVSAYKSRETDLRSQRDKIRREIEEIKAELEPLHQKKRDIISDFRRREKEFKEHKEMREHKMKKLKEEEVKVEVKQKESEDSHICIDPKIEPYIEEKHLCTTLITYLQRYITTTDQAQSSGSPGPTDTTDPKFNMKDGMYVLPRKRMDDEEAKYSAVVRRTSSRNKRRDRQKKIQVTHTPEIFAQFSKLNLNAPSNLTEVAVSIEQLQGRKRYYDTAVPEPIQKVPVGPDGDALDSGISVDSSKPDSEFINSDQIGDVAEPRDSSKPDNDLINISSQTGDETESRVSSKPDSDRTNISNQTGDETESRVSSIPDSDRTNISSQTGDGTDPKDSRKPDSDFEKSLNLVSEQKIDSVENKILLKQKTTTNVVSQPKIEEEKESQGSDDVFYDDDDDVFCDDNQNISVPPLEKRRNFYLVKSRSDIKPLMANANFIADTIHDYGYNGFVMPLAHTICPSMTSLVENPVGNVNFSDYQRDASLATITDDEVQANTSADSVDSVTHVGMSGGEILSVVSDQDCGASASDKNDVTLSVNQENGTSSASDRADSLNENLSDDDVQNLLCEIKKLSNGANSDVEIERSTDSSDIMDSYESNEQGQLMRSIKMISVDEDDIIRPVICSTGRVSSENLNESSGDSLDAEVVKS